VQDVQAKAVGDQKAAESKVGDLSTKAAAADAKLNEAGKAIAAAEGAAAKKIEEVKGAMAAKNAEIAK